MVFTTQGFTREEDSFFMMADKKISVIYSPKNNHTQIYNDRV